LQEASGAQAPSAGQRMLRRSYSFPFIPFCGGAPAGGTGSSDLQRKPRLDELRSNSFPFVPFHSFLRGRSTASSSASADAGALERHPVSFPFIPFPSFSLPVRRNPSSE